MNFKVGDRIRVFGVSHCLTGLGIYRNGVSGFSEGIVTYTLDDVVHFKADLDYCEYMAHSKQCRRLKKKEPVTYWVNEYANNNSGIGLHTSKQQADKYAFLSDGSGRPRTALLELRLVKRHEVGK